MHASEHASYSLGTVVRARAGLRQAFRDIGRRWVRRQSAAALLTMNDNLLRDIGLTRADALRIVRNGGRL